jgi:hypothetical protein
VTDLAALLQRVIAEHADRINAAAEKYPDEPIEVELHWHPSRRKVETVVRASDRLAPFTLGKDAHGT